VLEQVCLRCLHKDPGQRYPSARELADDLRRWLRGQQPITDVFNLIPGYRLERELGRGGLGVVHEATQLTADRRVALKVFNQGAGRVLRPIRAAARLTHPNLVVVYDCGERDGRVYVAEELIEGTSLDRVIEAGPQPPREAARLLETLARALHHVHAHGMVHRNLKPRVVLLASPPAGASADGVASPWGIPKVSSFDLAVLTGDPAREEDHGEIIGTPRYMAPEQTTGYPAQIGPATDIHALGLLLYELLTGRPLFVGETAQELLDQVLAQVPRSPNQIRASVPSALGAICAKCLAKDPARRYPRAAARADDLHGFLTRPGGLWQGLFGWLRGKS
jgi:serine/threonine protein kinase